MLRYFQASDGEWLPVSIAGRGLPLVLMHGWTSSHREWLYYATALADVCRGYCWDARGHGMPALAPIHAPTLPRMAKDLHDLITHFRLQGTILLGHSMGALTAWEYISRYGCRDITGLVLVDQSPRLVTDDDWKLGIYGDFDESRNRDFIQSLRADFAEAVLRLAAEGHNGSAREDYKEGGESWNLIRDYLRELSPAPLIACWESLARADFRSLLPTIDIPVLLVYGECSNYYGAETAEFVRAQIPGSHLQLYPDADHSPHIGQRERFLQDVREFVCRLANRGS
jgi:pimeloyl-ACP methyl ester carboxylesterase